MTTPPQEPTGSTQASLPITLSGLALAVLLSAMDQTIVATALPTIAGELGGVEYLAWIVTAYLLTATASHPIWGKLGDLYGRKPVLLTAMVLFLVSSALCGVAQDVGQLIAFRGLQGIGAGGLMSLVMATVSEIVPPRERGRYQGYLQSVFVIAGVSGPLLGGLFVDQLSWRWVFYLNIPFGIVALIVVIRSLRLPKVTRDVSIDYLGSALLIAATVSIMLITIWGGSVHSWGSPLILGLVAAVFVLLALFVVQERRAPEPVVPLRLFAEPVFVIGSAVLLLTTSSLFVVNVFVPLYLQTAAGTSGTEAGLVLIPLIVATVTMQTICGRLISRTGRYRWFPPAGLLLMSAALALLSQVGTGTSRWLLAGYLVLFGLGFGMVTQVVIVAVQNAVGFRDLGVATASANFFRSLGGAIGTTIFGTAFATQATNLLPGVNALEIGPEQIRALPPTLRTEVTGAIGAAIDNVFLLAAPVALLGFLIALGLRDRPMLVFGGPPSGSAGRGPQTGAVAGAPSSAAGRAPRPRS